MKYSLPLVAVLALFGAGCAKSTPPAAVTPTDNTNTPAVVVDNSVSSLSVHDQKPGSMALVNAVILGKPGYVVVHADADNKPGAIVGQSALLSAGGSANVNVPLTLEQGKYYWAMLHTDNGDNMYNATEDGPTMDAQGNMVMMRFQATDVSATVPADEGRMMAPTGTEVNIKAEAGMEVK